MASSGPRPVRTKSVTLLDPSEDNGNVSHPNNGEYKRKTSLNSRDFESEVISDGEECEQTTPMLSSTARVVDVGRRQAATPTLSHLTGENGDNKSYLHFERPDKNMDLGGPPKPISPTGKLAWVGFGLSVAALACMCISFASPYWLQQWELSFNTFNNMGLWEACFHNYMHHRDDLQEIYNGCFWVYNPDEKYNKLRDWLVPRTYQSERNMHVDLDYNVIYM
jgi:hypothetical protein